MKPIYVSNTRMDFSFEELWFALRLLYWLPYYNPGVSMQRLCSIMFGDGRKQAITLPQRGDIMRSKTILANVYGIGIQTDREDVCLRTCFWVSKRSWGVARKILEKHGLVDDECVQEKSHVQVKAQARHYPGTTPFPAAGPHVQVAKKNGRVVGAHHPGGCYPAGLPAVAQ